MKRPTIDNARQLARQTGSKVLIILAFDDGIVAGASYGDTKLQCRVAGEWMDRVIDQMSAGKMGTPLIEECPWPGIMQDSSEC